MKPGTGRSRPSILRARAAQDPAGFIRANLPLAPAPSRPDIRLHLAGPSSRLSQLPGNSSFSPYWAFCWNGGLAIARYLLEHPEFVSARRVLDFGAGSGLVAIAAAKAGARSVMAVEIDPLGTVAISLNAAANGVALEIVGTDPADADLPDVDIVLAGDTFYDETVAARASVFFERCIASGIQVLVGDPGRVHLPLPSLREIARYRVGDFGDNGASSKTPGVVYEFVRLEAGRNLHHLGIEESSFPGP